MGNDWNFPNRTQQLHDLDMLELQQVLTGDGESDVIMIHMYHFIELKAHSINSNSVTLVYSYLFILE